MNKKLLETKNNDGLSKDEKDSENNKDTKDRIRVLQSNDASINKSSSKVYENALTMKKEILSENKDKAGVYKWVNKINGNTYIGSAVNLTKRIRNYYTEYELKRFVRPINLAILKYGHDNFRLEILEYCDRKNTVKREQLYLDELLPEYNVLRTAGSLLGYKHTAETLIKLKGRIISEKNKKLLSEINKNKVVSQETRNKLSVAIKNYWNNNPIRDPESMKRLRDKSINREGVPVSMINILTNEILEFSCQQDAATYLNVSTSAIYNARKRGSLMKGIYKIKQS